MVCGRASISYELVPNLFGSCRLAKKTLPHSITQTWYTQLQSALLTDHVSVRSARCITGEHGEIEWTLSGGALVAWRTSARRTTALRRRARGLSRAVCRRAALHACTACCLLALQSRALLRLGGVAAAASCTDYVV